jgi:hypothetical protein
MGVETVQTRRRMKAMKEMIAPGTAGERMTFEDEVRNRGMKVSQRVLGQERVGVWTHERDV